MVKISPNILADQNTINGSNLPIKMLQIGFF